MTIINLRNTLTKRINRMEKTGLFVVSVDKEELWNLYLDSFPEGTNDIYIERRAHDCNSCKQFIRNFGNVVTIVKNEVSTIWDIVGDDEYGPVVAALDAYIKTRPITDVYLSDSKKIGQEKNHSQCSTTNKVITWNHLAYQIKDTKYISAPRYIPTQLNKTRTAHQTAKRALDEITLDAVNTCIDLAKQNSVYRLETQLEKLKSFKTFLVKYKKLPVSEGSNYLWSNLSNIEHISTIRNSSVGSLLVNISKGKPLEYSVSAYESMVAPTNYKRTKSLVTKGMIAKAQKKVEELGIESSLYRRHAVLSDITINNVLWANRKTKKVLSVFDELTQDMKVKPKNMDRIDEVSIETFLQDILPNATSVQLMIDNKQTNNFVSLIAPTDPDAKPILQWDNNFSWSYIGELTDSIKERVKQAGGSVEGVMRASLSWDYADDLDINVTEPSGEKIYFGHETSRRTLGKLDVDANAGTVIRNPVENIIWPNLHKLEVGKYIVNVHNFQKRCSGVGFTVQIEVDNQITEFNYDKNLSDKQSIDIANIYFDGSSFKVTSNYPSSTSSKEVWGIYTNKFIEVNSVMNSPNYWDENNQGNKHVFFMLDGCKADTARGFYNEFLSSELHEHRKVFEYLGNKMKVEPTDEQISGVGFSTTQRNSVVLKVQSNFERIIKVNF